MTDDMIERVARALADAERDRRPSMAEPFAETLARAALAAMREPTDAMVDAAWTSWEDREGSKGFVGVWQAMIDEALK